MSLAADAARLRQMATDAFEQANNLEARSARQQQQQQEQPSKREEEK
jgi:hypothetical protein